MEAPINDCLNDPLKTNKLQKKVIIALHHVGSRPGVMHGLCKNHKPGEDPNGVPPFCPILSAIDALFSLVRCFVPLLKEHMINKYNVKNTFMFYREESEKDGDLFMTSFDIQSLFTVILLDESISICVEKVFKNKKKDRGNDKKRPEHF